MYRSENSRRTSNISDKINKMISDIDKFSKMSDSKKKKRKKDRNYLDHNS